MNTTKNNLRRGFVTSWKTKVDRAPKLREEFSFPTLSGMAKFQVVELKGNHCIVESGDLQGRISQDEEGDWYFKHMLWDKNTNMRVTLSDAPPTPPSMNPNIGFTKKYK